MSINKVSSAFFDYLIYEDYFKEGGFPTLLRNTFDKPADRKNIKSLPINSTVLVAGSSNWRNVLFILKCRVLRRDISIHLAPLGQLSEFLDYDNPFEFGDKFVDTNWNLSTSGMRRKERNNKWAFRVIYRRLWRRVFVKTIFRSISGVLVLSNNEANEVKIIHPSIVLSSLTDWSYEPYSKQGEKLSLQESSLNLLYFGRIDPYYKGLYELLEVMSSIPRTRLYLSGSDYRGGISKLISRIKMLKLEERVEFISKDMDSSMFEEFDYTVLPSYWEGYYRACADVKANKGRLIIRDLSNGDFFLEEGDHIFSTKEDLFNVLSSI